VYCRDKFFFRLTTFGHNHKLRLRAIDRKIPVKEEAAFSDSFPVRAVIRTAN
jgi:hypothetical protein